MPKTGKRRKASRKKTAGRSPRRGKTGPRRKKKTPRPKKKKAPATRKTKTARKTARATKSKTTRGTTTARAASRKAAPARPPVARPTADDLARRQRDISVAEFFRKNRHLLGFDNPKKALLTTIKEAVDNSLDACEEAGILPRIRVEIHPLPKEDRFRVAIEDNGPGIVPAQVPKIFAKLLYGSKFHTLKQSRGQQGIGISAAAMYGQVTTGQPVVVVSRAGARRPARKLRLQIDTQKNRPVTISNHEVEWDARHGTRVEIELQARFQRGRQSVDDYLEQTAIANPHATLSYRDPDGTEHRFEAAVRALPSEPREIRPHPYGVELGVLEEMLRRTSATRLSSFLSQEFSRISAKVAREICEASGLSPEKRPSRTARAEVERLYEAIQGVRIMAPPTDCLSPIGEERILEGLAKEIDADLFLAKSRRPAVYRGNPFLVEIGLAYGGKEVPLEEPIRILRLANRVPLLYQQGACAITRAVLRTDWKAYHLQQSRGALPIGPAVLLVHIASVWVPFTSESKEAIAHYPEILKEIKLGLQECGRKLGAFVSKRRRDAEAARKHAFIEKYIPHVGIALREILDLSERQEKKIVDTLTDTLKRSRK